MAPGSPPLALQDLPPEIRGPLTLMMHPVFAYRCPGTLFMLTPWAARIDAVVRPFKDDYDAALEAQRNAYAGSRLRR